MLKAGFDKLDRCAIELGKFRLLDGNEEEFETIIELIIKVSFKFRLVFVRAPLEAFRLRNDAMLPVPK